ncbi:RNA polymerase sigma factor SigY [Maioricimonas rarisocia]|uniref:RNA polymerase sigma factor SigY n=1 Tax=Maioricimonas rarisocia TaxID=2528026 RepID=A0A517ZEP1_9PLAN|nr:sigma factor-like helix-turn-helix DNA-binding protein [Maioricimonas rarisocia]QDU40937.1 RNA polymerase sigma factor SigY [Maioricimonas rarisocia]
MGESELKGLIASAKQGDERAFAELTRRAIEQRSGSSSNSPPGLAAPIVVETLFEAIRIADESGHRPRSRWFAWLLQLVVRGRQRLRSSDSEDTNTLRHRHEGASLSDSSSQLLHDTVLEPDASSEAAVHAELVRLTQRSLEALSPPDRTVLELRYWMGCTMPELARRLDCTEAEAARRLRLAIGSFRREMTQEDEARDFDK